MPQAISWLHQCRVGEIVGISAQNQQYDSLDINHRLTLSLALKTKIVVRTTHKRPATAAEVQATIEDQRVAHSLRSKILIGCISVNRTSIKEPVKRNPPPQPPWSSSSLMPCTSPRWLVLSPTFAPSLFSTAMLMRAAQTTLAPCDSFVYRSVQSVI